MAQPEFTTTMCLRDGRSATVRPLQSTDVEPLTTYLLGLSEDTRRRYGPHPFDRPTAERLCASIDEATTIRFIAIMDALPVPEIIGYMILTRVISAADVGRYGDRLRMRQSASFAPSIADAYQSQGLGTQMAQHVMWCARQLGLRQVILMGGVQARNERARRLYTGLGFRPLGEFWTHGKEDLLNYDMALEFEY